jgi:glutathione S-transferase
MAGLLLYGNRNSGHAYKARLFLTLASIEHDYENVDLDAPRDLRPESFRGVAKFGEVPVLLHDRAAIVQSNAILLHLARHTGRFGPPPGASWDDVTMWLFWEANRVGFSMANLRSVRRFAPAPEEVAAWLEARATADLARLDGELASRAFLLGSEPCIADLSCCAYLFLAGEAGIDVARYGAVSAWLDRIRALPGYRPQYELMA